MDTELFGSVYLFNLSILAITFAAVSALVMLLRQTMGGKLSNFDVHLIATYVGTGFVLAIAAILPPFIAAFGLQPSWTWSISSGLAAFLLAATEVSVLKRRRRVDAGWKFMSLAQKAAFAGEGLAVVLLAANALIPAVQGLALFEAGVTLALAVLMWTFVRRISSLLGDKPGEDWDPKRG